MSCVAHPNPNKSFCLIIINSVSLTRVVGHLDGMWYNIILYIYEDRGETETTTLFYYIFDLFFYFVIIYNNNNNNIIYD